MIGVKKVVNVNIIFKVITLNCYYSFLRVKEFEYKLIQTSKLSRKTDIVFD